MTDFAERYGPWAVVAGASEGLGASFAASLARRGVHLVLVARRMPLLLRLADGLRTEHGVDVRCVALDLGESTWPEALHEATADVDLGLLVYNAAMVPVGRFVDVEGDALERSVRVNVLAPVRFLRAFLPTLCARGRGGVVLMSSLSGLQGTPRVATYAATKAFNAILGACAVGRRRRVGRWGWAASGAAGDGCGALAEGLWHELRDDGVDVVACSAGAVPTPGYRRSTDRDAPGMLAPDVVANRTLEALGRGPGVVPGALNRFMAQVLRRVLPRRTAIRLMAANTRHLGDGPPP